MPPKRLGHRRHLERRDGDKTRSSRLICVLSTKTGNSRSTRAIGSNGTWITAARDRTGTLRVGNTGAGRETTLAFVDVVGAREPWMLMTAPGVAAAQCSKGVKREVVAVTAGIGIAQEKTIAGESQLKVHWEN